MSPSEVRALSLSDLEQLYASLSATELPVGTYDGHAWSFTVPIETLASWVWRGKVFTAYRYGNWGLAFVRNRIGSFLIIRGEVDLAGSEVVVKYPQLRLTDYLKPVSSSLWLGYTEKWGHRVWFMLERMKP